MAAAARRADATLFWSSAVGGAAASTQSEAADGAFALATTAASVTRSRTVAGERRKEGRKEGQSRTKTNWSRTRSRGLAVAAEIRKGERGREGERAKATTTSRSLVLFTHLVLT